MRISKIAILFFLMINSFSIFAQNRSEEEIAVINNRIDAIFKLGKEKVKNGESNVQFWKTQLKKEEASHPAIKAAITYQIGKNYVLTDIDSALYYIKKASITVEQYDEFPLLTSGVYNGLGNITTRTQKTENASFYHNKAAIVCVNDSLNLIPTLDKTIILLSAANVNTAVGRNLDAIDLLENARKSANLIEEENDKNRNLLYVFGEKFKAYDRFGEKQNDSLLYFLKQAEVYAKKINDNHKLDLYYGIYYKNINQLDSSIYRLKKSADKNLRLLENNVLETLMYSIRVNYFKSNLSLAEALFLNGDVKEAQKVTKLCSKLKEEIGQLNDKDKAEYYKNLANYYYSLKNLEGYKEAKEKEIHYRKSLEEVMTQDFYREFKTFSQLEAKEKSISTLQETVSKSTSRLTYAKIIVALLILAMISTLLLARNIFLRRRAEQKMQETQNVLLEQKLLRTQMEPHFIFNTLNTLKSLINLDYKEKSLQYLGHFSRLLRNSLELSRREFVLIKEEVDTLRSYLSLQEIRSNYQFEYKIEFDEEINPEKDSIPPMLIQPFVENSIIHGFRGVKHKGLLTISLKKLSSKMVMIRITDNGAGIDHNVAKLNHKSLSGTIAKERLAILSRQYNTNARYELESKEGQGTIVTLYLPVVEENLSQ